MVSDDSQFLFMQRIAKVQRRAPHISHTYSGSEPESFPKVWVDNLTLVSASGLPRLRVPLPLTTHPLLPSP